MINKISKQCKTKGCNNPVLDGKRFNHCRQKRKEIKNMILAAIGITSFIAFFSFMKKEIILKRYNIATNFIAWSLENSRRVENDC